MQYGGTIGRVLGMAGLGLALTFSGCAEHRLHEVRTYIDENHNGRYDLVKIETIDVADYGKGKTEKDLVSWSERELGWEATEEEIRKYSTLEPHPGVEIKFEK